MVHTFAAIVAFQTTVYVASSRGWLAWIFIGLLAGWLAGHLTRGRGFGCVVNVILGLIGAVLGGWLFTKLGLWCWDSGAALRRRLSAPFCSSRLRGYFRERA